MLPLAEAEGLGAHAQSLTIRTRGAVGANAASSLHSTENRGRSGRRFKLGVYFDLYSDNAADWEEEAEFNRQFQPEMVEVLLEHPGSSADLTKQRADMLRDLIGDVPITVHAPTLTLMRSST